MFDPRNIVTSYRDHKNCVDYYVVTMYRDKTTGEFVIGDTLIAVDWKHIQK